MRTSWYITHAKSLGNQQRTPPPSNRTAVSPDGIKSTCLTIKAVVSYRPPGPAAIFTIIAHVFPSKSRIQQPREPQLDSIKYLESPTAHRELADRSSRHFPQRGIGRDRADICLKFICKLAARYSSLTGVISMVCKFITFDSLGIVMVSLYRCWVVLSFGSRQMTLVRITLFERSL